MDVALRILGLQEEQLGRDQIGDVVGHRRAQENDAVLEQTRKNIEGALATTRLLDNDGD